MEAILAIVGVAFAVPGTIVAFAQCGEYIHQKISTFKNAPNAARELGRFGRNLHQGKIKINLELADWAYNLPDLDPVMKDGIEDHLEELRSRLRAVEYCLDKMFDKKGQVRTAYYTFLGEKKAERLVQSLREWEHDFSTTLSLIEMRKRVIPQRLRLTSDKFRRRYQSQLGSNKRIMIAAAEIPEGDEVHEFQVLVERKEFQSKEDANDLQEVARILVDLASRNTFTGGILKCLGYSVDNDAIGELIFEIPEDSTRPQSLRDVIQKEQDEPFADGRPLDHRSRLARLLCDAVVAVFTSGLVHKSIRTDTILLIAAKGENPLGSPYLSSWTLLRKAKGLTSGTIDDDTTTSNFYRHPKRQGIQPEDRYNMGHDIYSLGVCLLEVGLWAPLLDANDRPCQLYREIAVKLNFVSEEESKTAANLTHAWMVAEILPQIAKEQLPQRMGSRYTDLTVACLTCLDGGMGDSSCFRKTPSVAAVRFNELIAQSFNLT